MKETHFIISFLDLWRALKKGIVSLLITGSLLGAIFFLHQLFKPIHYTAKGVFKKETNLPINTSFAPKAMEFLLGEEKNILSSGDAKAILLSYPVLEGVVKTLNLQAKISQKQPGRIKRVLNTWRTESIYRRLRKMQPDAHVTSAVYPIPNRQFFSDRLPPLKCIDVEYAREWSSAIQIVFKNEENFELFENKKRVGRGKLGEPFDGKIGRFTLEKVGESRLKRKKFNITFIPLYQAVKSLEKQLTVKRDKENVALIHVTFTHDNRLLAAEIVNATMREYSLFLNKEKMRTILEQLSFLEERRKEGFLELDTALGKHKEYLEKNLEAGEIVSCNKEIEFVAHTQEALHSKLNETAFEMTQIASALNLKTIFSDLVKELDDDPFPPNIDLLTVDTAKALLATLQQSLEDVRTENERYNYCLSMLAQDSFEPSALSTLIGDASLNPRFEKIHTLHRNLVDEKNWSEKEKELMRTELKTEKNYLAKHLEHLKEGTALQETVFKNRISATQKTLLFLLRDLHKSLEKEIENLARQALHFPQKWLTEKKIEINSRLQSELVETLSRLVDAKSIGANLNSPSGLILARAYPPSLPDHPKLYLSFGLGFGLGVLIGAFFLCLREIVVGPTASSTNLRALGYQVCGVYSSSPKLRNSQTLRTLVYHLRKKGNRIAILSKQKNTLAEAISTELNNVVIKTWKGGPQKIEVAELLESVDSAVYLLSNERLREIYFFPKETLFVTLANKIETPRYLSLRQVHPLLDKLIAQARAKSKSIWHRLAKRI